MVSKIAAQKTSQVWCHPETEKIIFDAKVAIKFAELLDKYIDALQWCSGSGDFGPGGKAEEGWKKICKPLLEM
jgi:hypothetical protein